MTAQFPFSPLHLPGQRFNYDEYIAFIRSLLQRHRFSPPLIQDIQTRLKHLEHRAHDPHFYVAFIGEFNSGKTTFINALLREELLKQSVILHTSVPTKIRYGAKLDLAVRFVDEQTTLHFTAHDAQVQEKMCQINPQLHQELLATIPTCLHLLTTDKLIAPRIQEVTVFHQAHFLRQGIVIIDTPGINAPTESHRDITRRVLTDDADLAVITIPAYAAFSGNLVTFLKSDLQPFLSRSIIILTHMDTMTEHQQSQVLTSVHARLQEIAPHVPRIQVYTSAAQVVLDELDPGVTVPETKRAWISRFSELEEIIWKRLSTERTAASTESLLRLLNKLLKDLTTQLQEHEVSYRSRQAALEREQNMVEFLATKIEPYTTKFEEAIDTALGNLDSALRSQQAQAQNLIEIALNSASDAASFKRVVDQDVARILKQTSAAFKQECERIMIGLQQQGLSMARSIEDGIASAYQHLAQIEGLKLQLQVNTTNISADASLSEAQDMTTRIDSSETVSAWGGVIGGGIIGQILIPGLGTVIGGFVGAALSQLLGSVEKRRNEVREALQPALATYFNSLREFARKVFQDYIDKIKYVIQEGIDQHVHDYKKVIINIREQQDEEQQQITILRNITEADLTAIRTLLDYPHNQRLIQTRDQMAQQQKQSQPSEIDTRGTPLQSQVDKAEQQSEPKTLDTKITLFDDVTQGIKAAIEGIKGNSFANTSPSTITSSTAPIQTEPINIFYCYSRQDLQLRNELSKHLALMRQTGLIAEWYDGMILAGNDWQAEITNHLDQAQIILLLISPAFLTSNDEYDVMMKNALERHITSAIALYPSTTLYPSATLYPGMKRALDTSILPIILSETDWQEMAQGTLPALPSNGKSVTSPDWLSLDDAFEDVVEGIREVVQQLIAKRLAEMPFDMGISLAAFYDLDPQQVRMFLEKDRVQIQQDYQAGLSDQAQMEALGLLRGQHPSYGALLCFGHDPSRQIVGAYTRCIYWRDTRRLSGWRDDKECQGNLLQQFTQARNFLQEHLHFSHVIEQGGSSEQPEIPFRVLEEALANALVHREYVTEPDRVVRTEGVLVEIFSDRIEISSPGGPPAPLNTEHPECHPRNPQIMRIFYLAGYVEQVGTGIMRMQHLMQEAGLPQPDIKLDQQRFTIILFRPVPSVLNGHNGPVHAVAVTPNGHHIISASQDRTLKIWDVQTGVERLTLHGHTARVNGCAVSPHGDYIISASQDGTLKIWDVQTGVERLTLCGHTDGVNGCAVSPHGNYVVSASQDRTLKVWDVQTGVERLTLHGHTARVNGCAVSPRGDYIISASQDGTLKIWDVQTGVERLTLRGHTAGVNGCAVSPHGDYIVSASQDGTLKVWDVQTGKQIRTLSDYNAVLAVAVTPDARFVLSACADSTLKVWDIQTGKQIRILSGHSGTVHTVAVTHDGHTLVSGSDDKTIRLWDIQRLSNRRLNRISHDEALAQIDFVRRDLLELDVDALVDPVGTYLVDTGSIGSQLIDRIGSELYQELRNQEPLKLGEAFVTGGGSLATRYLIHTRTQNSEGRRHTTKSIVKGAIVALHKAESLGDVRTIAFPALGSGHAGLDPVEIAPELLLAVTSYLEQGSQLERVIFAFINEAPYQAYINAYRSLGGIVNEKEVRNTYRISIKTTPNPVTLGQRTRLHVELLPVQPSQEEDKGVVELPQGIAEVYCFVSLSDRGLRIRGTDVVPTPIVAQNKELAPVDFELQASLPGTREYTVDLFVEDPVTTRRTIFQAKGNVTIEAPEEQNRPSLLPSLLPLDVRVALQPPFVLQVDTHLPVGTGGPRELTYRLTSRLPGLVRRSEAVGQTTLPIGELKRIKAMLAEVLQLGREMQPEDSHAQMLALGTYLFDRLFPIDEAEAFRTAYWQVARQITTCLIIEDGITWLPWELVAPYREEDPPCFLCERYQLSRWVDGLGTTLYSEVPVGEIALAYYQDLESAQDGQAMRSWKQLLSNNVAEGIMAAARPESPFYALHLLRRADQVGSQEMIPRNAASETLSPNKQMQKEAAEARLDLRLKRPIVTLSMLSRGGASLDAGDEEWPLPVRVLPFLQAGASAVVGPWWPTDEMADQAFWSTFYDLLMVQHETLGEAVWWARRAVAHAFPQQLDWLAYVLFGNPRARPYEPEASGGYGALECINPDEPLRAGKTYYFRASIRIRPPIWHEDRLVRVQTDKLPQQPRALFLAPGIQQTMPTPVTMHPSGRLLLSDQGQVHEMLQAMQEFTPEDDGEYLLTVHLMDGKKTLQSLQLPLLVGITESNEE